MQFNPFFCGQNRGQQMPCNTNPYNFQSQFPEFLPEGEIATIVNPDGSISYFLVPTNKRGFLNHNLLGINSNPIYLNTYSNPWAMKYSQNQTPLPAAFFSPQYPGPYSNVPLCKPDLSTCCNNFNTPNTECNHGYQLKFHHDTCTSTTDLHYFFPGHGHADRCAQAVAAVRHCGCNHDITDSHNHVMFVDEEPMPMESCQKEKRSSCRCGLTDASVATCCERGAGPSPSTSTQTSSRNDDELQRALDRRRTVLECCVLRQ